MGLRDSGREEKRAEAIFEEVIAENVPELKKDLNVQIQKLNKSQAEYIKRNPHLDTSQWGKNKKPQRHNLIKAGWGKKKK